MSYRLGAIVVAIARDGYLDDLLDQLEAAEDNAVIEPDGGHQRTVAALTERVTDHVATTVAAVVAAPPPG